MTVAVISGTTSGLGREFVDAVMGECPEIDEIWMIARRQDRLESIAAEYPRMRFVCLPFDLSQDDGYAGLEKELRRASRTSVWWSPMRASPAPDWWRSPSRTHWSV